MSALLIVHIIICILLVIVVLLQASSGMDLGSAFGGGGSSDSFFGSKGSSGFLIKLTSVIAAIFMFLSILMSYNGTHKKSSVIENMKVPTQNQQNKAFPLPKNK